MFFWNSLAFSVIHKMFAIWSLVPLPRGATQSSRSGGAAVRRYPSSKIRSSGCTINQNAIWPEQYVCFLWQNTEKSQLLSVIVVTKGDVSVSCIPRIKFSHQTKVWLQIIKFSFSDWLCEFFKYASTFRSHYFHFHITWNHLPVQKQLELDIEQ